jgi:hypothetical protein
MLKKTDVQEVYHIENIPHHERKRIENSIKNISESEKDILIKGAYISSTDAQYVNVWEVYNEEVAKLVRQIPRGNDEAEGWFRKHMGNL